VFAFASHSDWSQAFKYDTFKKQLTFRGKELKDEDIVTAQMWLQRDVDLYGIARKTVEDAITRRAHDNEHNSVVDWLMSLEWDGEKRLDEWIPKVYGVENDEYHRAVGSNWLRAMVQRLVWPGSKYDHVLVIQGGQGVRKTTSFSVLGGGELHVETTIRADSKDFLMQFDGRAIVEFSEGETLNRSETKALKAIITRTHDKYRAPYARSDEEHPRQCVFCMTTNDTEYLKDDTGNRRWLIVKMPEGFNADIDWLKENREQLFAEAYARREEPTWIYPEDVAREWQEQSRVADSIEEDVIEMYQAMKPEHRGEGITIRDVYTYIYRNIPEDRRSPVIERTFEWRVKSVLKGVLQLEYTQKRIEGERIRKWFPTIETDRACPYKPREILDFEE
jgi:predicted P-loop ATPase